MLRPLAAAASAVGAAFGATVAYRTRHVVRCPHPGATLLREYAPASAPLQPDCFYQDVDGQVSLAMFTEAFLISNLFQLERLLLAGAGLASTDEEARGIATGASDSIAAWRVVGRAEPAPDANPDSLRSELLMKWSHGGQSGLTWLAVQPVAGRTRTRLMLGSAILSTGDDDSKSTSSWRTKLFAAAEPVHAVYSRALVAAAADSFTP